MRGLAHPAPLHPAPLHPAPLHPAPLHRTLRLFTEPCASSPNRPPRILGCLPRRALSGAR
eukprot:3440730-Rhodomonas_salina.1